MSFDELAKLVEEKCINVCVNTGLIKDGDVFVAIKGFRVDGHDYISQAIVNGAAFIVHDKKSMICNVCGVEFVAVEDTSLAAGILSQASCGNPCDKLACLAVTGTNGKTTTSSMVRAIFNAYGHKCGLIGTIENDVCGDKNPEQAVMTTPDAITLAALMKQMASNGAECMCIEASSHSLDQKRLSAVNFKAAAFTNLTGDHLDYHKTMDNYLAAKAKLFDGMDNNEFAIFNLDDPNSKKIAIRCGANILWYSVKDSIADIYADIKTLDCQGCVYELCYKGQRVEVNSGFCGLHNVSNQLAATGLCLAFGLSLEQIAAALTQFKNVPGRLERIECGQDFPVFVDYAHTDDALDNVLRTIRPVCKGRLITVFGCGGDRDRTKRPRMATVAQKYSDVIFVTNDNPRTEGPLSIITQIKEGFVEKDACLINIEPNRREAIGKAVEIAASNDIILIAGKGHEDYQIIGEDKHYFSDREVATESLLQLKSRDE